MLLLLFEVGLDLSVRDLFAVGPSSLLVAVIGTASSLAIGTGTAAVLMPDAPIATHVFLGAAITATSVGITARVLKDMGASRSGEAKIILGAAVVDDVLALVVLGAVTAWVGAGPERRGVPRDVDRGACHEDGRLPRARHRARHAGSRRPGSARRRGCGRTARCSPSVSASASSCRGRPARSAWRPWSAPLPRVWCSKTRIRRSSFSGASDRWASSSNR